MNPPIQTVRVSQKGKEALQRLKNRTKIENWNTLCRWALCMSLSMDTPPPRYVAQEESNVEMDWKTFAGAHSDILCALLRQAAAREFIYSESTQETAMHFRAHLERGISSIQGIKSIRNLLELKL